MKLLINFFISFTFFSIISLKNINTIIYNQYIVKNMTHKRPDAENHTFVCRVPLYDCSNHGYCNDDATDCICNLGYKSPNNSYVKCLMKQKSKMVTLLLESLISHGVGYYYIGNNQYFVVKFIVFILIWLFNISFFIFLGALHGSNLSEKRRKYAKIVVMILLPVLFGWYLFDIVLIATNQVLDANNIELY